MVPVLKGDTENAVHCILLELFEVDPLAKERILQVVSTDRNEVPEQLHTWGDNHLRSQANVRFGLFNLLRGFRHSSLADLAVDGIS
ncbi:Hypothetical protein RG540_CH26560 [Neorhizobium galegae bv. orientalis str. HAMBI 540]|uniref:Uncharacterized protein n=1 Tax=Neorhizobium galegae bv. orientalis str. HAMBI 540 TaxID=1028800 RepID=A0A068SR98_NEOGA|nr:Hypothetical protein RG540_CH26560 [Neorhizobium galegae bv. orientalis str. HAMBI 540]